MISFIISLIILVVGYLIWGKVNEKIFDVDDRQTPAISNPDGVDRVPISTWKAFLIQLLNIAGTGPIFGALMGAVFGPIVFLWIVLGCIFAGAVHDIMTGMISCRHNGASIAELTGIYLGHKMKWVMRIFSIILLLLVGTVFVTSPAALIAKLTPDFFNTTFWIVVILVYYLIATLLPIDRVIGKIYPIFGIILILMALGIIGGIFFNNQYTIPEFTFSNLHPKNLPAWPFMCITVACGAISGFHATQSPMVAKCIKKEKDGKPVFFGAMISEGIIALIWAAAGVAFYGATDLLHEALSVNGASDVVYEISKQLLGTVGGILAIIGVVVCPITSGDTAFRSARLILAEIFNLDQKVIKNRLIITLPILGIGALLTQINFDILWRYFSWSNQTLAMIALWVCTAYLLKKGKYKYGSLITAVPAVFMTAVSVSYILMAEEGLRLSKGISYPIAIVCALTLLIIYIYYFLKNINKIYQH